MQTHTPGPWEQQMRPDGVPFGVGAPKTMVDDVDILCCMPYPRWRNDGRLEQLKANAILIAAAPMMLDALMKTIEYLSTRADGESNELWATVAAAASSATGVNIA